MISMAGDKNCIAQSINNEKYEANPSGNSCKMLGSPFHKRMIMPWYEWLKILVMSCTIAPCRLLLVIIMLSVTWAFASLALFKADRRMPLTGWRLWCKSAFCVSARSVFFFGGFHWITSRGRMCSVREAPILVLAPHSSYLDSIIIVFLGMCSVVGKLETSKISLVGKLLLMTEPILVSREEKHSRRKTIEEIQRRARLPNSGWPHVAIFPEGTCTNRSCLIRFKQGAFIPAMPVQPVLVQWPNRLDTTVWTWDGPSTWTLLWLSLCQFHNRISVEFLPVYSPSQEEQADVSLFSRNVEAYMAKYLRVPVSDYCYEDSRVLELAIKKRLPCASVILELLRLRSWPAAKRLLSLPPAEVAAAATSRAAFAARLQLEESSSLLARLREHYACDNDSVDLRRFVIDVSLVSDVISFEEAVSRASCMFANSAGRLGPEQAREVAALVLPGASLGGLGESALAVDDLCRILLDAAANRDCHNVFADFHEQMSRLRKCY